MGRCLFSKRKISASHGWRMCRRDDRTGEKQRAYPSRRYWRGDSWHEKRRQNLRRFITMTSGQYARAQILIRHSVEIPGMSNASSSPNGQWIRSNRIGSKPIGWWPDIYPAVTPWKTARRDNTTPTASSCQIFMAVIQQWDNSPDIALPTKRERAELTVLNLKQSRNYQRKLGINDNDYRYLILSEWPPKRPANNTVVRALHRPQMPQLYILIRSLHITVITTPEKTTI